MLEKTPIVKEPNKILRRRAKEVPPNSIVTPRIKNFIVQMKETLASAPDGVGLAAPQVGELLRLFIVSEEAEEIDRVEKEIRQKKASLNKEEPYEKRKWKYYVFINPVVRNISKKKLERTEGCLSVPGKFGDVKRHEKITVEAYDERGQRFTRGASRFFARVIQHELDHLEGTLFIDKAEKIFEPKAHDNP